MSAEQLARRMKISRSKLYSQAVEEFISDHKSLKVKEKLDEVYGKERSSLDPALLKMQELSLPKEQW